MNLNESDFRTLLDTTHGTVVAFFGAAWCGPCKVFAKAFESTKLSYSDRKEIKLVKLDVDECTQLCEDLNVSLVPTVIIFKDSQVKARNNGAFPTEKAFSSFIEENL